MVAMHVSVGLHATAISQNTGLFVRLVSLVISVQRNRKALIRISNLTYEDSPRVADICAEYFCTDDENRDTSRSTESKVDFRLVGEGLLDCDETSI